MNMHAEIKHIKKEFVYNNYVKIVDKFKDYDKITSTKMLDAIYKVYDNYKNIIDICTERELKYLKKVINKENNLYDKKYKWERNTLWSKFLIIHDFNIVSIPGEIEDKVKLALKNINWNTVKFLDRINEIIVGFIKIQGNTLVNDLLSFAPTMMGISEDELIKHMLNNKVFKYYVKIYEKSIESIGENIPVALYDDYFYLEDDLDNQRRLQGLKASLPIDTKILQTIFYNDFDINNKKIKKMLNEIEKLPFFYNKGLDVIKEFALLNIDRKSLKESFLNVPSLKSIDLTNFFKTLDEAMDEMPSGALNGFTPNQAKQIIKEEMESEYLKEKNYIKQDNAHLSNSDAKLFYKLYYGLLEYTNKKYKIKPKLKIYKQNSVDLQELIYVIEQFWKTKVEIINEFIKLNPYKFNKEELEIVENFKQGFRDTFIIGKYEIDYTIILNLNKTYMIKGIYDNVDEIVSYQDLPQPVITAIMPFKDQLIYDGLLQTLNVKMDSNFEKIVNKEISNSIKYYHL